MKYIAAIAILVLLALTQKNEPAKVTVNVPEQKPPVINVPAQQPPVVNIPAQQPPVVNVPAQPQPVVNVQSPSGNDLTVAVEIGVMLVFAVAVLIVVWKIVMKITAPDNRERFQSGFSNAAYVKTDHGWEIERNPKHATTAEYPDLFTRDKVRK